MTTDIESLTGPALSAAVAVEVMGWRTVNGVLERNGNPISWWKWCPEECVDHAREVIAEIQRRGLQRKLINRLLWECSSCSQYDQEWYLLTVPPSDICRAALRVVREQINNEMYQQSDEELNDDPNHRKDAAQD